jgi:ferredoxin
MAINKVWIIDGCTACGLCVDTCPDVFHMEEYATVTEGADLNANEAMIKEAAETCPVEVIKYE